MQHIKAHESSGVHHDLPPVIPLNFKSTLNLKTPSLCQSCQWACSMSCVPKVKQPTKAQQEQAGALSWDAYETDKLFTTDHYVVTTPVRMLLGYEKEYSHDAATGFIWAENQVLLGAEENWMVKEFFQCGYRNWLLLKYFTFTVTKESSMLNFLLRIARTSSRLCHFPKLVSPSECPC